MPKVICTLPNASEEISGVKFTAVEDGMLSEDISDEQADHFLSIPGYKPADGGEDSKKSAEAAARAALLVRAEAVKLKVDDRWKLPRLEKEVADAEEKAKAAGGQGA